MNDNLILSEVAATLSASPYTTLAAAVPTILQAQAAADTTRPLLTISGEFTAYRHTIRKGTLTMELRTRIADDDTAAPNHQAIVELIITAMLGAQGANLSATTANRAAALAAFKAAISARGKIDVRLIAPGETFIEAGAEGDDLVTTIALHFIAEFLPQV